MNKPYTQLENETLEAMARGDLTAREMRVLFAILRLTNGYHLQDNQVSIKYLLQLTTLDRSDLYKTIKSLSAKQAIARTSRGTFACHGPALWKLDVGQITHIASPPIVGELPTTCRRITHKNEGDSPTFSPLSKTYLGPDTASKENIKKTPKENRRSPLEGEKRRVIKELEKRRGYTSGQAAAEASAIQWMLKHGYSADEISRCYDAMKSEQFWAESHLSMVSVKNQIGEYKARGFLPRPALSRGARPGYGMPLPTGEEIERSWKKWQAQQLAMQD